MREIFVIAIAATLLAPAGQALGQYYADCATIQPTAYSNEGEGISDTSGNPLTPYSAVEMVVLNSGVTESTIKTLFAAGNVQGILNDLTPLCATAIGVGDSIGPGTTAPGAGITDFSLPGYFYGVPGATTSLGLSTDQSVALEGQQVYMLAVNAAFPASFTATTFLTSAAGITQMGMWTIKGPAGNGYTNDWILPVPNPILPTVIYPDPGDASPTDPYDGYPDGCTLDAVIGPGERPCGAGWITVFNDVWPGSTTAANVADSNAVQLASVLPGDANSDGRVDINDLTIVLANYGRTGTVWSQGEFTGDGTVDINDLTIVLANYGRTVGASAGGMAAVPEPAGLILLGLGAAGLAAGTRRRLRQPASR